MSRLLDEKKEAKHQSLLDAAYSLFLEKGAGETSISEIVQRANVAKGTFYLYFHNKDDILQALVFKISHRILSEAYSHLQGCRTNDFAENVIVLIDFIIEYFKRDQLVLRLLERNFSWPLVEDELARGNDPLFHRLMQDVRESPVMASCTEDEMFKRIFVLLEMCGSTCYSSIILGRPDSIEKMKPVLYDIVRKSLSV